MNLKVDPPLTHAEIAAAGWSLMKDDGFIALVGPMWVGSRLGHYGFIAEDKHRNRGGVVMGGMLMTFADRSLGATSRGADSTIASQATVQFGFEFVDAVEIGEFVEIDCEVIRQTKTLVFMRGTLRCGERVVGTASGIWKVKKRA